MQLTSTIVANRVADHWFVDDQRVSPPDLAEVQVASVTVSSRVAGYWFVDGQRLTALAEAR